MKKSVSATAYKGKNIKKVVIKEGVVSLPDNAFKDCKKLTSVKISSTVKNIGVSAIKIRQLKILPYPKQLKSLVIIYLADVKILRVLRCREI